MRATPPAARYGRNFEIEPAVSATEPPILSTSSIKSPPVFPTFPIIVCAELATEPNILVIGLAADVTTLVNGETILVIGEAIEENA